MGWHSDSNRHIYRDDVSEVIVVSLNVIIDPKNPTRLFQKEEIEPTHLHIRKTKSSEGNEGKEAVVNIPQYDGTIVIQPEGIRI